MKKITDLVPEADDLLALEPAEIGGVILQSLISASPDERSNFHRRNFILGDMLTAYPRNLLKEVKNAIMEGWSWLLSEGLIIPAPESDGDWIIISRKGHQISTPQNFRTYRSSSVVKKEMLHPRIAEKAWSAFLRADYESAIFVSFREVEIRVRELSGLPDEMVGTDLMRRAFGSTLSPTDLPKAEHDSIGHLFAGAIGWFKNPLSHRNVKHTQIDYAVQSLMFASHLLNLAENMSSFQNGTLASGGSN